MIRCVCTHIHTCYNPVHNENTVNRSTHVHVCMMCMYIFYFKFKDQAIFYYIFIVQTPAGVLYSCR